MKTWGFTIVISSILLCVSCGRMISDRSRDWNGNADFPAVDTFAVYKSVPIDLSHQYDFDFSKGRIVISVNNGQTVVFSGDYTQLVGKKVKLPAPLEPYGGRYPISVQIFDSKTKQVYSWSSDVGDDLLSYKLNMIELLYTGTEHESAESVTLNVVQTKNYPAKRFS